MFFAILVPNRICWRYWTASAQYPWRCSTVPISATKVLRDLQAINGRYVHKSFMNGRNPTKQLIYEFIPLFTSCLQLFLQSQVVQDFFTLSNVSSKESMSHSKSSRSSYQAEDLHHKEPQKHKWIAATWRFEKGDIPETSQKF